MQSGEVTAPMTTSQASSQVWVGNSEGKQQAFWEQMSPKDWTGTPYQAQQADLNKGRRELRDLQTNQLEALFLRISEGTCLTGTCSEEKELGTEPCSMRTLDRKSPGKRGGDRARKTQKLEVFRWNTFKHFAKRAEEDSVKQAALPEAEEKQRDGKDNKRCLSAGHSGEVKLDEGGKSEKQWILTA